MTGLTEIVQKLIGDGADANDLQSEFEEAVCATQQWGLWGDGHWRRERVCSECGSLYPGLCDHFPRQTAIPLKEWLARRNLEAEPEPMKDGD